MAKTDRRIRYTKQVIKQSLFELLDTMPLSQITVKALCEKAEINRATFYKHYETLADLIDEIEYEECRPLFDLLDEILVDGTQLYHSTFGIIQYLKGNPGIRKLLLAHSSTSSGLVTRLRTHLTNSHRYMTDTLNIPPEQAQLILSFVVSGSREVLRHWFETDMEDEELMVRTLVRVIHGGIYNFVD